MNRVKWKGPYIKNRLLKSTKTDKLNLKNNIKTVSKNSLIFPRFVGLTLRVYNGKTFIIVKIIDEMVGHKLGEFVSTRKQFSYKKGKKITRNDIVFLRSNLRNYINVEKIIGKKLRKNAKVMWWKTVSFINNWSGNCC